MRAAFGPSPAAKPRRHLPTRAVPAPDSAWKHVSALLRPLIVAAAVASAGSFGSQVAVLAQEPAVGGSGVARQPADGPPAVAKLMRRARVPGLARAVVSGGAVAESGLFGLAHADAGVPVTADTLFEAASLSKPVFATIVLRLAERGELDLDRPLHELLPYQRIAHDPRSKRLTARLVLSHQTGLPNWGPEKLEFEFEPGAKFGYSGEGYVYLQRVVETVTGQSLEALARREVFEPLGMLDSRFAFAQGEATVAGETTDAPARDGRPGLVLAAPHDQSGTPRPKRIPEQSNAASSLHTTAADYARFVASWIGAGEAPRLLSKATLAKALSPAARVEPGETASSERRAVAERLAWGLGWGLFTPAGGERPVAFHWGDNGDFKAFVAVDWVAGIGVVYFGNSANGLALGDRLAAPVADGLGPLLRFLGYGQLDDPGWSERLEGTIAAGEKRYRDAVAAFEAALAADPGNQETARWVAWLADLARVAKDAVDVPAGVLAAYAGHYGPRSLRLEEGRLVYQREGRSPFPLIPIRSDLFALDGLVDFRLEVVVDEAGEAVKLVGHYIDGSTDENPRSDPSD